MTIKIIEAPDNGRSWWHIDTHVKAVQKREIIYDDGSRNHKNYFAKVEILSMMDAPDDYYERRAFFAGLLGLTEYDVFTHLYGGYIRLSSEDFEALDLPTNY